MKFYILIAVLICVNLSKTKGYGNYHEVDLSNPQELFLNAIKYAKQNFVSQCQLENVNSSVQLQNVIKAEYQIVAGTNYRIVFKTDHYSEGSLTVNIFASLPSNGKVDYEITGCN